MGRDRNKPKGDLSGRDHYSNRDVNFMYYIYRFANHIWYVSVLIHYFPIQCTIKDHAIKDMIHI